MRRRTHGIVLALAVAVGLAGCSVWGERSSGDAVLTGAEGEYYSIDSPTAGIQYSWGLPLLTTKKGRGVTLRAIRLLHAPSEVVDVTYVRIRYEDLGRGVGVATRPLRQGHETTYKPLPVLNEQYDDVDDDQIVVQFRLTAAVTGRISGVEVTYDEHGVRRTQSIDTYLVLGASP